MMLHLTNAEMLEYRRNLAGLEPSDLNFTIERTDGIDIDAIVGARLRRWYVEMLHTAPVELLPVEDVASAVSIAPGSCHGSSALTLPAGAIRPLWVKLRGWEAEVPVLPSDSLTEVLRHQDNPFTAASTRFPVAVEAPGNPGTVLVFPAADVSDGAVVSLKAVKDPGDTSYVLDEALLNQLPTDRIFLDL